MMSESLRITKPKKTAVQLVSDLSNKGVTFSIMSESQAEEFLQTRNNYFRLMSYKKNFTKNNEGKYVNLDFGGLVELSKLDMYMRYYIVKCCIDIEHCLKVRILHDLEHNSEENGYDIVEEFINEPSNQYILGNITRKANSHYSGDMIAHYFNYKYTNGQLSIDCPVWAFLEMISFGTLVNFYAFYYKKYGNAPVNPKILNSVKSLRNACAHNNCIMHNLNNSNTVSVVEINNYVANNKSISTTSRRKKLKNQFIFEFSSLLYVLEKTLSPQLLDLRKQELKEFSNNRLITNISYFSKNLVIKSSIDFLHKSIDNL